MHVRRIILGLVAAFLWAASDPDLASGQSSELMEAYNSYTTLYQQGRYSEAEPYAKEALRLATEEFGPNDPSTAFYLNELAVIYRTQGRYAEAEPLFEHSLAIWEKDLGPEHPYVVTSLNNFAELYRAQGNFAEAEMFARRALEIAEKALGPDHPHVAMSANMLGLLLNAQGEYAEAVPLHKRALAINEKTVGQAHPRIAIDLQNLAFNYQALGYYGEAEPLYQRSLARPSAAANLGVTSLGSGSPRCSAAASNISLPSGPPLGRVQDRRVVRSTDHLEPKARNCPPMVAKNCCSPLGLIS